MHGDLASARRLAGAVAKAAAEAPGVRVAVFPPFVHLAAAAEALKGSRVALGAQDCFWEARGAFTGEVSPAQLADLGCRLVLVGHSERRHVLGETDAVVSLKLRAALAAGLEPVLGVGETLAQREAGLTEAVLKAQLGHALQGLEAKALTLAYEPVWAIGTGRTASPEQAREAHAAIRAAAPGWALAVLYGGSVKPENLRALLAGPGVDGALVGGASLDAGAFSEMIRAAGRP